MTRLRTLLPILFLLPACGEPRDLGLAHTPTPTPTVEDSTPAAGGPRSTNAPKRQGGGSRPTPVAPLPDGGPGGGEEQQPRGPQPQDGGNPGDNAAVYLRDAFPKLVVEIDVVQRTEPTQAALDHVRSVMSQVLSKPGGIDMRPFEFFAAPKENYTDADLEAIEASHRKTFSGSGTASMYMLFLNGEYTPQRDALAIAYSGSSFAVFGDKVREAITAIFTRAPIERSVLTHELGHLLRLVNLGYTSPRNRHDDGHRGHSTNKDSVMYYAVEDVSITRIYQGQTAPPDKFDADDRADLADLKAGRL